ncbi:hypothetical protein HJG60_008246 [Phyllostomus discolor]|uniref:Uncharacterized protein n=1 Tax=Phyllostomus discolor TaxID=89673 RepID=A0A834DQ63_9CHIR|nr:hypothetical protein HJG60_008246 [Phyllostomus discolor]
MKVYYFLKCFKYILLIMLLHFVLFLPPVLPSDLHCPTTNITPCLSSCPWVIHINSLTSPLPVLFLISPCLFCTYYLCFLSRVIFPPFSPLHLPADNPPFGLSEAQKWRNVISISVILFMF